MSTNLIGLSGYIGSGKDTVAGIIQNLTYPYGTHPYTFTLWQNKKFAAKLKQIASLLTGIPASDFENQDVKNRYLSADWNNMQVRLFLQKLGTDCVRENLHINTWVNALFADYDENSKWILTDMRFPNEVDSVKSRGGITIRINRISPDVAYTTLEKRHISETAIDDFAFDHVIENNGSLDDLHHQVEQILIKENIL